MKKIISFCLIITILVSNFAYVYANEKSAKEILMEGKTYNINGREITVKLDMEKIMKSKNANSLLKQIDKLNNESMNIIDESIYKFSESLDDEGKKIVSIVKIKPYGDIEDEETINVTQENYKLVQFPKGFAVEYIACSEMDVTIYTDNATGRREIVGANNFGFDAESMSTNGDIEDITINHKISSNKRKVTMTTNYTVTFGFDIPIFDEFGIPIEYSTDMVEVFEYNV